MCSVSGSICCERQRAVALDERGVATGPRDARSGRADAGLEDGVEAAQSTGCASALERLGLALSRERALVLGVVGASTLADHERASVVPDEVDLVAGAAADRLARCARERSRRPPRNPSSLDPTSRRGYPGSQRI